MEQNIRNNVEGINTIIFGTGQQFPIDTKKFWAVSENKLIFKQFFINGLVNRSEITNCFEHSDGIFTKDCLLKCDNEKADECIMTHVKNS